MVSPIIVADASIIAASILPDENEPAADALMDEVVRTGAIVPSLFWFEVRNLLLKAERKRRILSEDVNDAMRTVRSLSLRTVFEFSDAAVLDAARRHGLSAYDATYAELTIRESGALATLDKALLAAGRAGAFALWQPTSAPPT